MDNRSIFDQTLHIHFRLKNIWPGPRFGVILLPNTYCILVGIDGKAKVAKARAKAGAKGKELVPILL